MSAAGAIEAVERIVNRGGEAETVLRDVERAVAARLGREVTISRGPEAPSATSIAIVFAGVPVGALDAGDVDDDLRAPLARIATLVSPYLR